MRYPESLVGEVVVVQLARPVYLIGYAGDGVGFSGTESSKRFMLGEPVSMINLEDSTKASPVLTEVLPSVVVRAVHEGSTTFLVPAMDGSLSEKTIHNDLIVAIDLIWASHSGAPTLHPREASRIVRP